MKIIPFINDDSTATSDSYELLENEKMIEFDYNFEVEEEDFVNVSLKFNKHKIKLLTLLLFWLLLERYTKKKLINIPSNLLVK